MGADATDVEVLETDECFRLMSTRFLGRVGATVGSLPVILPVCYVLDDDVLVIRLGRGSGLAATLHHDIVAFEVDDLDPVTGVGWSVLVRGIAREVAEPDLPPSDAACLAGWLDPVTSRYVGIFADVVSGRRVRGVTRRPDRARSEVPT